MILISLLLLLIVGLAVGVYLWLNSGSGKSSDAIQGIPTGAAVVVRVDDFAQLRDLMAGSSVWESLSLVRGFSKISDLFSFTDSLKRQNYSFRSILADNPVYLGLSVQGNGQLAYIFSIKIPEGTGVADLYSLAKLQAVGLYQDEERTYNGTTILSFKRANADFGSVAMACCGNILLVSNSAILVEESIAQIDGGNSLMDNPQFVAINKTSGSRVDANVYINLKQVPEFLQTTVAEGYRKAVYTLADAAQWIELDLSLSSNSLLMSGLASVSDTTNSYLRIFTKQQPVPISAPSVIPVDAALFVWLGISDLDGYLEGYRAYLDRKNQVFAYTQSLSDCRKLIGTEVQEYFKTVIDNELGVVFAPLNDSKTGGDWYIIGNTHGASATAQYLRSVAELSAKASGAASTANPVILNIDKEKKVEVYPTPVKGLCALLFGSLFHSVSDNFYCFVDNWIVWGESPQALERYVKSHIRNNVLGGNGVYKQFSEQMPNRANFLLYVSPSHLGKLSGIYLSPKNLIQTPMSGLQGISYQLSGGNNLIFNTLTITSGRLTKEVVNDYIWETKLNTTPATKPFVVINHTSKEKEILIQDTDNTIYLINSVGRVLWKRKVDGLIMGDVTQVDLFKNRKLQYAFSTATALYVVDRNGADVSGFPVKYSSTGTNPVAVIDYDGSRDYRFFQACTDRKIYVFDSKGKPVKGWRFGRTETPVTDRIGFVRVGGLDYIVVFDANRLYYLNRKGEERVRLKQNFGKAPNSTFALGSNAKGQSFIVTTDTIGLVRYAYLDGRVDDIALQSFSKWHSFLYNDLDGDTKKDFIFLDNQTLSVYGSDRKLRFQLKLKDEVKPEILFFDFGGNNKIGVVSEKSGKIYLVNSKGKVEDGFPYNGSTSFSITRLTKSNNMSIIVGSKQGTVINYGIGR